MGDQKITNCLDHPVDLNFRLISAIKTSTIEHDPNLVGVERSPIDDQSVKFRLISAIIFNADPRRWPGSIPASSVMAAHPLSKKV